MTAVDLIMACKQKTRTMKSMEYLFNNVIDVFISPGFGAFQPLLTEEIVAHGLLDYDKTYNIMRFSSLGNLIGIPGMTLPVGYSSTNQLPLPVMLQSSWWREDILFRVGYALEKQVEHRKPSVYFDITKPVE